MIHIFALYIEQFIDFGYQLVSLMQSHASPCGLTITKGDEGRNRLDAILACQLRILVHIYLHDIGFVANCILDLLKYRCLHLAGAAPSGIKVDQSRF